MYTALDFYALVQVQIDMSTERGSTKNVCLFVCLFVVMTPDNPDFASRLGLEVNTLGVYPLGPRSSSCGPTKGTPSIMPLMTNMICSKCRSDGSIWLSKRMIPLHQ
jgi:hypothetical protein